MGTNKPCRHNNLLPGGIRQAVLRRDHGRCVICSATSKISLHHIVPRNEGGLDEADNLITLCVTCHDEIEEENYRTRDAVMRHIPRRQIPLLDSEKQIAKTSNSTEGVSLALKKTARSMMGDLRDERMFWDWLLEWDRWFSCTVLVMCADDSPPPDPDWYAVVYGGGVLREFEFKE